MQVFYFVFEVEPQVGNPKSAHASRAVAHLFVPADDLDKARESVQAYLASELWKLNEEIKATPLTPEQGGELKGEEFVKYQAAENEGRIHEVMYYWHRSE